MSGRYEHRYDEDCGCVECTLIRVLQRAADALDKVADAFDDIKERVN